MQNSDFVTSFIPKNAIFHWTARPLDNSRWLANKLLIQPDKLQNGIDGYTENSRARVSAQFQNAAKETEQPISAAGMLFPERYFLHSHRSRRTAGNLSALEVLHSLGGRLPLFVSFQRWLSGPRWREPRSQEKEPPCQASVGHTIHQRACRSTHPSAPPAHNETL